MNQFLEKLKIAYNTMRETIQDFLAVAKERLREYYKALEEYLLQYGIDSKSFFVVLAFFLLLFFIAVLLFKDPAPKKEVPQVPQLAIVVTNLNTKEQIDAIQMHKLRLTPAIFPPNKITFENQKAIYALKHYMVFLPLESNNEKMNIHHKTLMSHANEPMIVGYVKIIRQLFPKATYITNHSGSKFMAEYDAMFSLYNALKEEGFHFIDARTTAKTQAELIARESRDRYLHRDVFLDHKPEVEAIQEALTKAVKIAKKRNYAIAYTTYNKAVLEVLNEFVFEGVEVTYIDALRVAQ